MRGIVKMVVDGRSEESNSGKVGSIEKELDQSGIPLHQQKRRSFIGEKEDSIFDILLNDENSFTTKYNNNSASRTIHNQESP